MSDAVWETNFEGLVSRGKVRDTYRFGDVLLMVATDRLSAFDVILPTPIPGKGVVLTMLSSWWFGQLRDIVPNHEIAVLEDPEQLQAYCDGYCPVLPPSTRYRSVIVRPAEPLPIECVVRGYLSGSAWAEYQASGSVNGDRLPAGMVESERFPEPRFTPSTKATEGHDQPLTREDAIALVGKDVHDRIERISLEVYSRAEAIALQRGVIIADTKLEFGWIDGEIALIDEALTPDSSRFWPRDSYAPGGGQHSFDKQFVRDWLDRSGWDRVPPAPELPADIVEKTAERYRESYRRLTGNEVPQ